MPFRARLRLTNAICMQTAIGDHFSDIDEDERGDETTSQSLDEDGDGDDETQPHTRGVRRGADSGVVEVRSAFD